MKTNFLLIVLILTFFVVGCKKDEGVTNAPPPSQQEDWTYPAGTTRDTVTTYCDKQNVAVGEEFDVKLVLYNVAEVFGVAIEMNYASDKSDVLSALAGPFFPSDNVVSLSPKIEPDSNRISYGITRLRGSTSISGSGVVIKLKCKGKAAGNATFAINPTKLEIRKADGTLMVRPIADLTVVVH
ncbi:MAG: cohesin domain-containing protein [Bacteroidota bacterium]